MSPYGVRASEESVTQWMESLTAEGLCERGENLKSAAWRITAKGKTFEAEALKSITDGPGPKGAQPQAAAPAPVAPENETPTPSPYKTAAMMFDLHTKAVMAFSKIVLEKRMRSDVRREIGILLANVDMLIESGREMAGSTPVKEAEQLKSLNLSLRDLDDAVTITVGMLNFGLGTAYRDDRGRWK